MIKNKKSGILIIFFLVILIFNSNIYAKSNSKKKPDYPWGIGLVLGGISGVSVKYWQDVKRAYVFSLGAPIGSGIGIQADYLFHLRPFEREPSVPVYIGGGVFVESNKLNTTLGAKGTVGISYIFKEPFDVFVELSPKMVVLPEPGFDVSLAMGGRIYLDI